VVRLPGMVERADFIAIEHCSTMGVIAVVRCSLDHHMGA
jgi:hypothetical protein